jgi:hypothetical protein
MYNETLKNEIRTLAEAQATFELYGWIHTESIQKDIFSNSTAFGTVYEKGGKKFFLNIISAPKAIQMLKNV